MINYDKKVAKVAKIIIYIIIKFKEFFINILY